MKIRVTFTLDIDPESWASEYGLDKTEVREDIQAYLANEAREWMNMMGHLKKDA